MKCTYTSINNDIALAEKFFERVKIDLVSHHLLRRTSHNILILVGQKILTKNAQLVS